MTFFTRSAFTFPPPPDPIPGPPGIPEDAITGGLSRTFHLKAGAASLLSTSSYRGRGRCRGKLSLRRSPPSMAPSAGLLLWPVVGLRRATSGKQAPSMSGAPIQSRWVPIRHCATVQYSTSSATGALLLY